MKEQELVQLFKVLGQLDFVDNSLMSLQPFIDEIPKTSFLRQVIDDNYNETTKESLDEQSMEKLKSFIFQRQQEEKKKETPRAEEFVYAYSSSRRK
jgi:hypothetical protein